jgi:signal peptidase I
MCAITARRPVLLLPSEPASASRLTRIAGVGAALIGAALLSPVRPAVVVGTSMTPTLAPGQVVWCHRASGEPPLRRGDVVLARVNGSICVKRVFAVGGDRFWKTWGAYRDENLPQLLNVGTPLRPWKKRYPLFRFDEDRVPFGTVYLLGDGVNSEDSRSYGPVATEAVVGRVVFPRVPLNLKVCAPSVWSALPYRPAARTRS